MSFTSRTARCGPARRVVWQGRSRWTAPYADRPAWAHSWRCKSSRELVTVSEVKRNCMRATECGKEAWSVNHEPMDKNLIGGVADQGERA